MKRTIIAALMLVAFTACGAQKSEQVAPATEDVSAIVKENLWR